MNSPACSNCGAPLDPTAAACSQCGMPLGQMPGQSPGPQGQAYGQQGQYDQAHGQQGQYAQPYGHQAQAGYPAPGPAPGQPGQWGQPEPGSRKPWVIPAVIAAVLLLVGGVVLLVVLLSGGDDDSKSDDEPTPTGSTQTAEDPTDDPTDQPTAPQTSIPPVPTPTVPSPTAPSPVVPSPPGPGTLDQRTSPTGSDEEQITQLTEDFEVWYRAVADGTITDCSAMNQFFAQPEADSVSGCEQSAQGADFEFSFEISDIKVSGDTAKAVMNTEVNIGGTPSKDADDIDLIKRDGYWFFADD